MFSGIATPSHEHAERSAAYFVHTRACACVRASNRAAAFRTVYGVQRLVERAQSGRVPMRADGNAAAVSELVCDWNYISMDYAFAGTGRGRRMMEKCKSQFVLKMVMWRLCGCVRAFWPRSGDIGFDSVIAANKDGYCIFVIGRMVAYICIIMEFMVN